MKLIGRTEGDTHQQAILGQINGHVHQMRESARREQMEKKTIEALEYRLKTLTRIFWEALRKYNQEKVSLNIDSMPELDGSQMKYKVTVLNHGENPFGPNLVETLRQVTANYGYQHERIVCIHGDDSLSFYFYDLVSDMYDLAILAD